jgi:hypothetical protein
MQDDDWDVLRSFFPSDWQSLAVETGALKGLRKDKNAENLLRTLLMHLACGYSLRETAVRARQARLAELSDVALLKRLRKCRDWLYALCRSLLSERGLKLPAADGRVVRAFDATTVKEPGRTGSLWRIHYSLSLPALECDFFKVTETRGKGAGETFVNFPISPGDSILADAGYCTVQGAVYVEVQGGYLTMRFNPAATRVEQPDGTAFDLIAALRKALPVAGPAVSWPVRLVSQDEKKSVSGRLCAIRKSREAIELAHRRIRRRASKRGSRPERETFVYAEYVIVFTTVPASQQSPADVLPWYRVRWQIELVFKRFKQLARLGHLPKYEDESSKAWLYGKLLVALLVEKMRDHAKSFSPWGYHDLETDAQFVA